MALGLKRFPAQKTLRLINPSKFRLASLLRMGCPMPFGSWLSHCECGKVLDKDGYHLLSCKHGGGLIWQHDSVVSCKQMNILFLCI